MQSSFAAEAEARWEASRSASRTADFEVKSKLRALGRMLGRAGTKIASAAGAASLGAGSCCLPLASYGEALQGAAEDLVNGRRWEAVQVLSSAMEQCGSMLMKSPFASASFLKGGPAAEVDFREILAAFSWVLETQAEVCCSAQDALHDAVSEAAASVRAAKHFLPPMVRDGPGAGLQALENIVAGLDPERRRRALRLVLKQYHPDRNPGREAEVLPIFLRAKAMRDEAQWAHA